MEDILNQEYGINTVSPDTPMSDFIVTPQAAPIELPQGAIRNRAATSALLQGDPNKVVDSFQLMMQEGAEGSSATHDAIQEALAAKEKTGAMGGIYSILGDKNIPLEQKKRVMDLVQKGNFKIEPSVAIQTAGIEAPSKGEDVRGSAARLTLVDVLKSLQDDREFRQKAMNHFNAQNPEASVGSVVELAEADVLPFSRNVVTANINKKLKEQQGVPTSILGWVKDFLTPGSTRKEIMEKLNNIPPAKRQEYTNSLLNSVRDSSAIFHNDNYYNRWQQSVSLLNEEQMSTGEAWAENAMTVLDAFFIGEVARGVKSGISATSKAGKGAQAAEDSVIKANWELVDDVFPPSAQLPNPTKKLEYKRADQQKRLELQAPVRREHAVSPYSVAEQTNPEQAAAMMEAIHVGGDDVAQAMTGVNKEQAMMNAAMPQVGTESDSVLAKANVYYEPFLSNTGALRYTKGELESAVDTIKTDFRAASGLEINDAMTTFRVDGDRLAIDAHYTTSGGAWLTPEAAKAQAEFALRKYGILPEEITVMAREGMDYVPAIGNAEGDYIIKVKTKHPIQDNEVVSWNPLDVKRNWTDRISITGTNREGTLAGSLFDPASMLHPTLTGSMSVAADKSVVLEKTLIKPIADLRNRLGALSTPRRKAVEEYMIEANNKGLKFDAFDLTSRGFNTEEISALKQWRDVWDGHYYLENLDLARTMNNQGYQIIESNADRFFAKPVPKNSNIGSVYDISKGKVTTLSQNELDSLYNQGGSYAKLRRPATIAGEEVEHIIVRNTPSEYLRKIRETDPILNYREGYFTVEYKAPKFVDMVVIDKNGKETFKTVAVAGNTKDAELFAQGQTASTGVPHRVREDKRGFTRADDSYWDLNEVSGRIAQRQRGKPLYEATGVNNLGVGTYIQNPMESAVRAANSITGRTATRPALETAKRRFVQQYGDMLEPVPFGPRKFPDSRDAIVDPSSHTSSRVADARTTWDYINYLERGYINSADEVFKGGMNILADALGKYHLSTLERGARAVGDVSLTRATKGTVFQAYIALSNPIRQWIVQAHQSTRTLAYNPIGFSTGSIHTNVARYIADRALGGITSAKDFVKFVDDSGMVTGVDKNSLVRGLGLDMADYTYGLKRAAIQVSQIPQKIGFDLGEQVNQLMHLSAVYDRRMRAGQNLADKTIAEEAYAEARALSYDLNKAGDLHYTQNSASMIMQFLQMPHKAILQGTNRKLPWDVKARMIGMDMIMWGLPVATVSSILYAAGEDGDDLLPNDPKTREIITSGAEAYALNELFTRLDDSGDTTRIDLSALSPYGFDGWTRMLSALSDKGVLGMIAASPTGQILAVDGTNGSSRNGRIPQAVLTMGRFVNVFDEVDPENPTEFKDVLKDVAKISSGWSAADKAMLMLETRRKYDTLGISVDSQVTDPEIYAAFLGFGTMAEKQLYEVSQGVGKSKKKHEEEVMSKYRDIMRFYSDQVSGDTVDVQHMQRVSSMLMRTFRDPADLERVNKQFWQDMAGKDAQLAVKLFEAAGMPNMERTIDYIKTAPVDEKTKDALLKRLQDMKAQRAYSIPEEGN